MKPSPKRPPSNTWTQKKPGEYSFTWELQACISHHVQVPFMHSPCMQGMAVAPYADEQEGWQEARGRRAARSPRAFTLDDLRPPGRGGFEGLEAEDLDNPLEHEYPEEDAGAEDDDLGIILSPDREPPQDRSSYGRGKFYLWLSGKKDLVRDARLQLVVGLHYAYLVGPHKYSFA